MSLPPRSGSRSVWLVVPPSAAVLPPQATAGFFVFSPQTRSAWLCLVTIGRGGPAQRPKKTAIPRCEDSPRTKAGTISALRGWPQHAQARRLRYFIPQSDISNPQSAIPNPQSPIPNPQSPIPNPQSAIRNPQSPIPNPQSPIPNPQSPIPNPQSAIRNPAYRIFIDKTGMPSLPWKRIREYANEQDT